MVRWFRLHVSTTGDLDLTPGWGTRVLHVVGHSPNLKKKEKYIK